MCDMARREKPLEDLMTIGGGPEQLQSFVCSGENQLDKSSFEVRRISVNLGLR